MTVLLDSGFEEVVGVILGKEDFQDCICTMHSYSLGSVQSP